MSKYDGFPQLVALEQLMYQAQAVGRNGSAQDRGQIFHDAEKILTAFNKNYGAASNWASWEAGYLRDHIWYYLGVGIDRGCTPDFMYGKPPYPLPPLHLTYTPESPSDTGTISTLASDAQSDLCYSYRYQVVNGTRGWQMDNPFTKTSLEAVGDNGHSYIYPDGNNPYGTPDHIYSAQFDLNDYFDPSMTLQMVQSLPKFQQAEIEWQRSKGKQPLPPSDAPSNPLAPTWIEGSKPPAPLTTNVPPNTSQPPKTSDTGFGPVVNTSKQSAVDPLPPVQTVWAGTGASDLLGTLKANPLMAAGAIALAFYLLKK